MKGVIDNRIKYTDRKVFTSNVVKYDELDAIEDFSELQLNDMVVVLDNDGTLECIRKFIEFKDNKLTIGNPMISMQDVRSYNVEDSGRKFYKVKDNKYNIVKRRISIEHTKTLAKEIKVFSER